MIFFEPKSLYRKLEEEVPEDYYELDLRRCDIVQEGKDLTIITYGPQVHVALDAAKQYSKINPNASIEIVDLQTVYPIDQKTIVDSVKRTGRCIVTHEAPSGNGISAEVTSIIQENCFYHLEAPIRRECGYDTPFPLTSEPFYLPNALKLVQAIKETLEA